jgi:sugar lactone lactonase YvrE
MTIPRRIQQLASILTVFSVFSVSASYGQIVPKNAKLEKLFTRTTGVVGGLTEGPAVGPDGSIYFTDITNGEIKSQIHRFDPKTGKTTVFAKDAKKANGLAFNAYGALLACEGADIGGRAVVGYDVSTGQRVEITSSIGGKKYNAPNDLCLDVQGRVYFTDPRYLGTEPRELEHRAVYRINLDGSVTEITHDVEKPNGIALSPDQKVLYVADHNNGTDLIDPDIKSEPGAMTILAFPLDHNGLVNGPKRVLVNYGKEAGCDGMTVDRKGNIYLTARTLKRPGIQIINPAGKEVGFIPTGPENQDGKAPEGIPSNVEFGLGSESSTLYITIDTSLYRIKLNAQGFQIPFISDEADNNWTRITLDTRFRSEGVAVADLNNDGRNDVIAGDVWYESPKILTKPWKIHEIRKPGNFVAGKGYSNSFANYAYDIDGDGWQDVIIVGFPGDPFHWYKNPGNGKSGHWKAYEIWHSICNESPDFVDITGDNKPEFVFGSQPEAKMGFTMLPRKQDATKKWSFHAVSKKGDPHKNGTFKYYHGLGYGDLNNDGRNDILIAHGWWEQPENPTSGEWDFHPYALGTDGVNPQRLSDIHVEDLDLDGDNDVIGSSAHAHGVWWFENVGGNKSPQFKAHEIDSSNSQTHAMEFADVDGDGQRDIITGKRFFAHNGGDPGASDPALMYWYEIRRNKGKPPEFTAHEIVAGRDTGIGTQFLALDFDGDGDLDIALSNKKGVNVLIQGDRPGTWLHPPRLKVLNKVK